MNRNRRGNMPFAVIAVTLLVLSTVAGAVISDYAKTDDGIRRTEMGTGSLQSSLDDIAAYVNRELGIIILEISCDDGLGSLSERAETFRERAEAWVDYRFPMASGDVTADLMSRDLTLTAEPMEILYGEEPVGGYVPSYLHGTGTISVEVHSQYGRAARDLTVSTDGSYALPLSAEQGSVFEHMVDGGGISLSQIMSYELECLAQFRVMNGYGAMREYGSRGTDSILTRDDVEQAYSNGLRMLGLMCFRGSDGELIGKDVDLADLMAGEALVIDRSAFYSQVMTSLKDDLLLGWYDYLCMDEIIDLLNPVSSVQKSAWEALIRFLSGNDPYSAESYIVRVMEENGVDPAVYRTPGSGTTTVTVGGHTVTVENPSSDIMRTDWVARFGWDYDRQDNFLKGLLRDMVNRSSQMVYGAYMEPVVVRIDPYDGRTFMETVSEAILGLTDDCVDAIDAALSSSMLTETFSDPFHSAIAETVLSHADEIADVVELRLRIEQALTESVGDSEDAYALLNSPEIDFAIQAYVSKVYSDLSVYSLLKEVDGGRPGIVLDSICLMTKSTMKDIVLRFLVQERVSVMMHEIVSNMDMNPYSGLTSMPDQPYFTLVDETGNHTREYLDLEYSSSPSVDEPIVVESKCTHITGFREDISAGYSTTFTVRVRDTVDFRVEGRSALSMALDESLTSASSGRFLVDIRLEVSVASGWALAGVQYRASDTVLDDAWLMLSEYLGPIMEPLREIMGIVKDVVDVINRCIEEIARYVSQIVEDMFNRITGPLKTIADWIEENVGKLIEDGTLQLYFRVNLVEQGITFEYLGYTFNLKFDLASMYTSVKTLFTATLSGPVADLDLTASITAKVKGEVNRENLYITGKATVEGDDWKVKIGMDPLMKGSKHLVTVSADVRNADISIVIPDLEDYNEIGITLGRMPGIGEMLSCIPVPGLGVNIGLDAGLSIKYTAPMATGLIINEYETNPAGSDSKNEWVELFNNSDRAIDLDGYTLIASSDRSKKKMTLSGTIAAGEFLVIYPTFLMVNTSGKLTKNGEGLTLKDPEGVIVDKTGTHKDQSDDGKTWQRVYDGAGEWEFKEGSQERSNGSYVASKLLTVAVAKDIVYESVQDAFEKVDAITDLETLQEVIRLTVKGAVERVIKKVAGCLVEASVFIKVDVMDPTSVASGGIRVALRCDSELIEDVLKYIAGQIESIALSMKNPYRIDAVSMFTDNIDLEVTFDAKVQYPGILARSLENTPKVDLGVTFRTNISAITHLLGTETGKPGFECGIRIIDCPLEIIPSKLSPKKGMNHDMWLFRMNIEWG